MAAMEPAGVMQRLDAQLDVLFSDWNSITTCFAAALLIYVLWPKLFAPGPDTHPLLLARQANISSVRREGESAIYRSLETSHGFPLKTGLNVKPPGAPAWQRGKDGDLRDIWVRAASGPLKGAVVVGEPPSADPTKKTMIQSIAGSEVTDHDWESMSKRINIIGHYFNGCHRVALYLPNSVEFLIALFAGTFYGFTVILLPYEQPLQNLIKDLQDTKADTLIAGAGHFPASAITEECFDVARIMWVVPPSSQHMKFGDDSPGETTWHELVRKEYQAASTQLSMDLIPEEKLPQMVTIWSNASSQEHEVRTYEQKHIVAAVAAQITALPTTHRLTNMDLFFPSDPLTNVSTLVYTLAALFSNASIAITSAISGSQSLERLASFAVAPTVIATSAPAAASLHKSSMATVTSRLSRYLLATQLRAQQEGHLPGPSLATALIPPVLVVLGARPGRLRVLHITEQAREAALSPIVSNVELAQLRSLLDCRVVAALAVNGVAGPIAFTNFYDYRVRADGRSHFGVPPACVELQVVDTNTHRVIEGGAIAGELTVRGPAAIEEEVRTGIAACFHEDGTLGYA